jgi:hypothetical protein
MKYKILAYTMYLILGIVTTVAIQAFFIALDYFYDGYWTLPTLGNFLFVSFFSGNFFGLFWYAIIRALEESEY